MDEEEILRSSLEESKKIDINNFFASPIGGLANRAVLQSNTSLKASASNLNLIRALQTSLESLRSQIQQITNYILVDKQERGKILRRRELEEFEREDDIQKGLVRPESAQPRGLEDAQPFFPENRFSQGLTAGMSSIGEPKGVAKFQQEVQGSRPFFLGGLVPGFGNADTVNAKLTPGEFVIPKDTVEEYGSNFFNDLIKKNENSFANVNEEFFFDTSTPKTNKNKHPRLQNFENFKRNYGPGSTERKEEYYNQVREVITPKMFQEFSNMNKSGKSNEDDDFSDPFFDDGVGFDELINGDAPTYKQLTEGFSTYDEDFDYFVKPEKKEDKGIFGGLFGGNKKNENVRNNDKNVKFNTYDLRNYDDDFSDPFFDDGVGFDELINDDSTVKSEDRRGLLGMIGGTIDAATGNLTDLDRRGGKPSGLMRGITGTIDAATGGLTDLDRRGGKPFGTMRLATGMADAMTGNLFDLDRRGDGKDQKIQKLKNKKDQLQMDTTVNPDGSITSKGSGTFIAGELVKPGEPLSPLQRSVMTMSMQMGNTYSPEIMEKYNNAGGAPSKEEFENYQKNKSDSKVEPKKEKTIGELAKRGIAGIADAMTGNLFDFDKKNKDKVRGSDENLKVTSNEAMRGVSQTITQPPDMGGDETIVLPPTESGGDGVSIPPAIPPNFAGANTGTTPIGETVSNIPYIDVISNQYLSIP